MKAKTHFQADPISHNAVRSFAEDSEEQAGGAETAEQLQPGAESSCTLYRELDMIVECGCGEKPLQVSPSLHFRTVIPTLNYIPVSATDEAIKAQNRSQMCPDFRLQLLYSLPDRYQNVSVKLPPFLVPTAIIFWHLKKVLCSRSFHPKS